MPNYFTYSFVTFRRTMITLYGLQTAGNHPDVFLKIYPENKTTSMFFLGYSFWTIYLVTNIVLSIVYVNYKKYYANIVNSLNNFTDYSKILAASYSEERQVVVLSDVEKMSKQYLAKGKDKLDLIIAKHYQDIHNKNVLDAKPKEGAARDTGCRCRLLRQHETQRLLHDHLQIQVVPVLLQCHQYLHLHRSSDHPGVTSR